ncbi:MAG TPA: hypothetical protein VLA61_16030 [Ideonella sp.]|uniref:hypothetical protein n=1 Tax=Ideonella sp. TaxID=1929293 RepID=UPI002CD29669|nr:hypothetical protein [Ideonella sp.]HSI49780.1 hypothetical protein [Ideonella sp.]
MLLRLFGSRALQAAFAALMLMGLLAGCGGGRTDPTLNLTVTVDGTAIEGSPLSNSGSTGITLQSGQSLSISSNLTMDVVNSPAGATISPLTRTGTSWIGTVTSDVATTMTLTLSSSDYPELSRTLTVNVVPTALAVTVTVDGSPVNATPIGADENYALTVNSGQVVAVTTNVKADFTTDLGDTRASNRVSSSTTWQATLTAAAAGNPLTVTAAMQGDSTRFATVTVTVTPTPLVVTAEVNDVSIGTPVLAGETRAINIHSGDVLKFASSISMAVAQTLGDVTKSETSTTSTSWMAKLSGATASTATLVVTSTADPTVKATLLVSVDPMPMALTLTVPNTDQVVSGQIYTVAIASGKKVAFDSNVSVNVAESLGSAYKTQGTKSSTHWEATLNAGVATEVLLTVTPQGDSTRVATLRIQVAAAPLTATVSVAGVAVQSDVPGGQTVTVNMKSNQQLMVTSNINAVFAVTLNGATQDHANQSNVAWASTLASNAPTTVQLLVKSAADSTQVVTLNVVLDQLPFAVNLNIDEVAQSPSPIPSGSTQTYAINSGQKVVLGSASGLPMDFSPDLGSAIANSLTTSSTLWGTVLTSRTATTATVVVTPQGATTPSITVKFDITPTILTLSTVSVSGVTKASNVTSGTTLNLPTTSANGSAGVTLIFNGNIPMTVTQDANAAVTLKNTSIDSTSYSATFTTTAATTVVLHAASVADPSKIITINLPITP